MLDVMLVRENDLTKNLGGGGITTETPGVNPINLYNLSSIFSKKLFSRTKVAFVQ
jgi:hypothetical protein